MSLDNLNMQEIIEQAQQLLAKEKHISKAFRAVLMLLFKFLHLMLNSIQLTPVPEVDALKKENDRLKELLSSMRQDVFGKKSEQSDTILAPTNTTDATISVAAYTRQKKLKTHGRNIDTSNLPRYKIYHDLDLKHKTCKCCSCNLINIGEDIAEQIETIPATLYVVEHVRYKYACRTCQTLVMAPKPLSPIPKALAGSSLLAEVAVNKYQYHLPLYRQSKIYKSYNIDLPDNTLGNWVMQAGKLLMDYLLDPLWQAVRSVKYLQVDESPVKVQVTNKKGYLWVYLAPYAGKGLVFFEFSLTRSGSIAEERLAKFKGLLQTDAYAGYNNLRQNKNVVGLGCLTHARRKFSEVVKITNDHRGIAAEFIERVKPLYALEDKIRTLQIDFRTRKRLRQKQAWPILIKLLSWLKKQQSKVPAKSKLANAINYTLNQWKYIVAYVQHGMAEIDTNKVENEIRPSALGKKNWLFMNNENSGVVNAFWYSLIQSALINKLNPKIYIQYLLVNIHMLRKKHIDPVTLLPHNIDQNTLQEFSKQQNRLVKQVINSS